MDQYSALESVLAKYEKDSKESELSPDPFLYTVLLDP